MNGAVVFTMYLHVLGGADLNFVHIFHKKNFGINKLLTAFNPMFPNFSALCVQLKMSLKFTDTYRHISLVFRMYSEHSKKKIIKKKP